MKLKELITSYEEELGLKGNQFDGTRGEPSGKGNDVISLGLRSVSRFRYS